MKVGKATIPLLIFRFSITDEFGGKACGDLGEIKSSMGLIVSTVPAAAMVTVPDALLNPALPTVVLDAVYRPRRTALLQQVKNQNPCRRWLKIYMGMRGSEILHDTCLCR